MESISPISAEESSPETVTDSCGKGKKCNKEKGHVGKCNTKGLMKKFWEKSPVYELNKKRQNLQQQFDKLAVKEVGLTQKEAELSQKEQGIVEMNDESLSRLTESDNALQKSKEEKAELDREIEQADKKIKELAEAYNTVQKLLEPGKNARRRRSLASTTIEMINDYKSSTRYRRRNETKNILEFIHGSFEASLYGAWDFLSTYAENELMCKLMSSYKRGKFIQGIFGKAISDYQKSEEALKQSIALKYKNFLSRRSYQLVCKTQSSFFNNDKEVWLPRNMKCLGVDLRLPKLSLSDASVDKFVKSLDIGHVSQIPNTPGVSRTVTGLIFMIIDLHLRVPYLANKLTWFNENENHFIFQFSDDGAPETSQLTMSIGSMVCWNFGDEVRSRDYQYLLHCASVGEKDQIMHHLWKQHTDEMEMIEGAAVGSRSSDSVTSNQEPLKSDVLTIPVGHESVGERARQQDFLKQSEIKFRQDLQESSSNHDAQHVSNKQGCGLGYLGSKIKEHYNNESTRHNKLPIRIIGSQAIALARYSLRLVDSLECDNESDALKIKRLALGKIGEYLRNAGGLFNRNELTAVQMAELKEMYFNLMCLFFPDNINVSTWTISYAIPYHASLLFEKYRIGYGIVSLQAKESKHAGVKVDLSLTNRSNVSLPVGKWWQVMRSNYVRSFYLAEHQPIPSSYISHYQCRCPPQCSQSNVCRCGREKEIEEDSCLICLSSIDVVNSAIDREMKGSVLAALKPELCQRCNKRFADKLLLSSHLRFCGVSRVSSKDLTPNAMSVSALKEALRDRGLSVTGNKGILARRLEGALAGEGGM